MSEGTATQHQTPKPIIGLAGGIGAGKSTVASILCEMGAALIASDRLNHEELSSPEVMACLRRWWGDAVIGAHGQADRDAIRKLVTRDPAARERLERLVHPRIARRSRALLDKYLTDPSVRAVVWDAPLLFEAGLADQCDYVIFVQADKETRRERTVRDRGWTAQDWERFEQTQLPLDVKKSKAGYTVSNNSDIDELRREVEDVFSRILTAG